MATTITAAAATALVLLLMIPLSGNPVTATVLVFLMGLTGFTVNPVVTALAVRFAGDAATLTSALTTSAFNVGIAAGSWLAGAALDPALGLTGPPLAGTVIAALTLLPLIALAVAPLPDGPGRGEVFRRRAQRTGHGRPRGHRRPERPEESGSPLVRAVET
ncbi:hypothetical protein [Streptomyces sp. MN13]